MLNEPMDILTAHPIRKTKAQKETFRADVQAYVRELGYEWKVETGKYGVHNIVIGDPKKAKYLVTAHYDTPARMPVPNLLTPCNLLTFILYQCFAVFVFFLIGMVFGAAEWLVLCLLHLPFADSAAAFWESLAFGLVGLPILGCLNMMVVSVLVLFGPANKSNVNDNSSGVVTLLEIARSLQLNQRDKVCFILFDLEEAGLIGSAAYRKAHKAETENQIVLNLDCVGDGDHIIFFPTRKAKKNVKLMQSIHRLGGWFGKKHIQLKKDGFYTYPSDQRNFPVGIGIAAFHKKKGIGYYVAKIHTRKDTILEETNVNLLRAALTTLICGDAVK